MLIIICIETKFVKKCYLIPSEEAIVAPDSSTFYECRLSKNWYKYSVTSSVII